ncbi:MAG: cytochrome c biogenesis protein ResB [bacterium]|nr:cytochrome c biogenesis protein ResB [bacterium]
MQPDNSQPAGNGAAPQEAPRQESPSERKPFKWRFLSSSAVILFVTVVGEFVGRTSGGLGGALTFWEGGSLQLWMVRLFFLCAAGWAWTSRAVLKRFFRSMYTGVSLVALSTIAVIVGVLVPQIDGFEDPKQRITAANYDEQYKQFQWAEGYFLYHIRHLYGIGMPEADISQQALDGIDEYRKAYSNEEGDNVEKRMKLAFSGSQKTAEIRTLLLGQDPDAVVSGVARRLTDAATTSDAAFTGTALPAYLDQLRGNLRAFRSRYHRSLGDHWRKRLEGAETEPFLAGEDRIGLLAESVEGNLRTFLNENQAAFGSGAAASVVPAALELVREHDYFGRDASMRGFFHTATALQLNRAYKSAWFATLLGLLGVAIAMNTFVGAPRTWVSARRAGFFVTHIGMLTMLIGGAVSKVSTQRGILHLDLELEPQNEFLLHFDRNQATELPFHVGLDRFARKEWVQVQVEFPKKGFRTKPPTYTLWEGKEIDLDYTDDGKRPQTKLVVKELHDRARVDVSMREAEDPNGPGIFGAAVQFDIDEPTDGDGRREYPIAKVPGFRPELIDTAWGFRLQTAYGEYDPKELLATLPGENAPFASLYVLNDSAGQTQPKPIEIAVGGDYETEDGYKIAVREAVPNFVMSPDTGGPVKDPRPIAEQAPANPAVWIEITHPSGGTPERRLVRQNVDAQSVGLQSGYTFSELMTWLVWDTWSAPGPPHYFLHWGPETEPVLMDAAGNVTPVRAGEPLPLVTADGQPTSTRVVPTEFHRRAVLENETEFLPAHEVAKGGIDEDFYAQESRGMVLEVISNPGTAEESVETVEMISDDPIAERWRSKDGELELLFFQNTALLPFEWRSVLSIYEEGPDGLVQVDAGTERQREIRVNDYFKWKGYRFFQTNASADFPTYSGIGVVYDPGIPIVLIGMYTIILGTVLAFIVRPIVLAHRKKGKTA